MRDALTSGVQGDQVGNVRDLISLAINAANLIQSRLNHQRVDQSCAVIVLVPVGLTKEIDSCDVEILLATPHNRRPSTTG